MMKIESIDNLEVRGKWLLIRVEPLDSVTVGSSRVDVAVMPSGIVIPVDANEEKQAFMHQTKYFVERCGPGVTEFEKGMAVKLKAHPGIIDMECGGVEYKLVPVGAVRFGMEVVEVAVG